MLYLFWLKNLSSRANASLTRMHSSRMHTSRSLTVCCSLLPGGGLLLGGVCLVRGGVCSQGVSAPRGVCTWSRGVSASGGCAWSWGCLLLGGVCSGGGSAPRWGDGYPSMHWGRHPSPLWIDTHFWKYYLGPTSLRPVKISTVRSVRCELDSWTSDHQVEPHWR